jgi:anti-anti-sigma regulatory factor
MSIAARIAAARLFTDDDTFIRFASFAKKEQFLAMFLATVSKPKQLLYLNFIGRVSVEQLQQGREDITSLLADIGSGFRVLADFSRLESMDTNCAAEIGKVMELCEQKGVGLVIRIIPDSSKDIGLNILTLFHYRLRPRIMTCNSIAEAEEALQLEDTEHSTDSTKQ